MTQFNPRQIPSNLGNYLAGFTDGEGSLIFLFEDEKIIKLAGKSLCLSMFRKKIQ